MGSFIKLLKKILTKKQYEYIRRQFRKLLKFYSCRICYPFIYKRGAKRPLNEKKVLFIETTAPSLSDNYRLIWERLEKYDFEKHLLLLHKNSGGQLDLHRRYKMIVKEASDAKYIFLNDAFLGFSHIKFRSGTKAVNTWHACGAFKTFGFGTAELKFGETGEIQRKYPNYTFLDEMYVSAPEVVDKYAFATGLPKEKVLPVGTSRTDMFFDASFIEAARKRFELFCPIAKGKKVILYAPTYRGTLKYAKAPAALSIPMLQEALSDEYVLVIKQHPVVKNQLPLSVKEQQFAVNFSDVMSIEELICVSDICISDYSSLVFEYSLFERPIIFFAYDKSDYDDWRGFFYNYDEMTPGPVFTKTGEIIDYIRHVDERFNVQEVIDFKNRFMASCDGHVTDRIIKRVFGDLDKYSPAYNAAAEADDDAALPEGFEDAGSAADIRKRLEKVCPSAAGKKIIAYVTDAYNIKSYPHVPPYMDWNMAYEYLPDNYVLIYSGPKDMAFKCDCIFKIPEELSRRELICAADIVVTNYAKEAFEGSAPLLVFAPEYKWTCSSISQYEEQIKNAKEAGVFFEDEIKLLAAVSKGKVRKDYDALRDLLEPVWDKAGEYLSSEGESDL